MTLDKLFTDAAQATGESTIVTVYATVAHTTGDPPQGALPLVAKGILTYSPRRTIQFKEGLRNNEALVAAFFSGTVSEDLDLYPFIRRHSVTIAAMLPSSSGYQIEITDLGSAIVSGTQDPLSYTTSFVGILSNIEVDFSGYRIFEVPVRVL